jgi:hypothetical protein
MQAPEISVLKENEMSQNSLTSKHTLCILFITPLSTPNRITSVQSQANRESPPKEPANVDRRSLVISGLLSGPVSPLPVFGVSDNPVFEGRWEVYTHLT